MQRYSTRVRSGGPPPGATLCHVTGKWSWKTLPEAEEIVRGTQANPDIADPPKRAYGPCGWCEGYHVTNMEKPPPAVGRRKR